MKTLQNLLEECKQNVPELFPWDLEELLETQAPLLILDVREPEEYQAMHIANSINVPRGMLEWACEWDNDYTVPELVKARDKTVIVACRSGNRSLFAARVMQIMGYKDVRSLQTGLRGWSDYELPLINDMDEPVNPDDADDFFAVRIRPEQMKP